MRLTVHKSQTGSTLALVPVMINGRGPFAFALDTGASSSVVDAEVTRRLGLRTAGAVKQVTGVSGQATSHPVAVTSVKVGNIPVALRELGSLDLPEPDRRQGLQGLLGSDALSQFHQVEIDYQKETLRLVRS